MTTKVLVVDDSEFFRDALAVALQKDGTLEVLKAKSGQEALDILSRDGAIKMLVLDVGMPIVGGKEVLRRLGDDQTAKLFIVVTGSAHDREALEECKTLGADEVLTKPLDVETLGRVLRQGLSRFRMEASIGS